MDAGPIKRSLTGSDMDTAVTENGCLHNSHKDKTLFNGLTVSSVSNSVIKKDNNVTTPVTTSAELTWGQRCRAVYRIVGITLQNLYCIPAYLVWMLVFSPLLYVQPELFWCIEGALFHWLLCIVGYWLQSAGYTVIESGADISRLVGDEAIVVCNHQSTADVPLLMYTQAPYRGVHENMMWIMEAIFKYTNFGWVAQIHGDFFILQGKSTRSQQLVLLAEHLRTVYRERMRKWVLIFPEGGFLRKRRLISQRYGEKNGFPILHHVSLPRVGATRVLVDHLMKEETGAEGRDTGSEGGATGSGSGVTGGAGGATLSNGYGPARPRHGKWLIDVTVGYPDGGRPLDFPSIATASRGPCVTHVHYRAYPLHALPHGGADDAALLDWLYARWEEKEHLLDHLYKHGDFPRITTGESPAAESAQSQEESTPVSDALPSARESPSIRESIPSAGVPPAELSQTRRLGMRRNTVFIDDVWVCCLHVFFFVSAYMQYYILSSVYSIFP